MKTATKRTVCLLLAFLLAVFSLSFAGCKGNDGSTTDGNSGSTAEKNPEQSGEPGNVTDNPDETTGDPEDDKPEEKLTLPGTYVVVGGRIGSVTLDRDMIAINSLLDYLDGNDGIDEKAVEDAENYTAEMFGKYKLVLNEDHTGRFFENDIVWREEEDGISIFESEDDMNAGENALRCVIDGTSLLLYPFAEEPNTYEIFRHEEDVAPFEKYDGDYYGTYKLAYAYDDILLSQTDLERQFYEGYSDVSYEYDDPIGYVMDNVLELSVFFKGTVFTYNENGEGVLSFSLSDGTEEYTLEGEPGGQLFSYTMPDVGTFPVIFYRGYAIVYTGGISPLVMTTKQVPEYDKWFWLKDDPELGSQPAAKAVVDYFGLLGEKDFDGVVQNIPEAVIKYAAEKNNVDISEERTRLADIYEEQISSFDVQGVKINYVFKLGIESGIDELKYLVRYAEEIDIDELLEGIPYEEFWKVEATAAIDGEESNGTLILIQIDGDLWLFDGAVFNTLVI